MDQQYQDEFDGQNGQAEPHLAPRSKPDGGRDPAGEAGWYLEREREARGISIDDAAHATGIHPYHIQAIEYGDMTHMPPRLEALEMIAAYADHLGFDPDPLLEHYVAFLPQPELAPRSHPANPSPMSSAKVMMFGKFPRVPPLNLRLHSMVGGRNGIVASVTTVFLLLSGTAWYLSGDETTPAVENIAQLEANTDPMPTATTGPKAAKVKVTEQPVSEETAAGLEEIPIEAPEESDVAIEVEGQADDLGAFITEQVDGGAAAAKPAKKKAVQPEIVASIEPLQQGVVEETPDGRIFGTADKKARVMLKATRSIWLLIEDGQGNRIATQLLNKGDMYRVPNRPGLVAIAQDGGAIQYMIDGKAKGLLGVPGTLLAAEPLDVKKLAAKG